MQKIQKVFGICFCIRQPNVRIIIIIIVVADGRPVNEKKTIEIDFCSVQFYKARIYRNCKQTIETKSFCMWVQKTPNSLWKLHVNFVCECVNVLIWLFVSLRSQEQANKRQKYFSIYGVNFYAISNKQQMCLWACGFVRVHTKRQKQKSKLK